MRQPKITAQEACQLYLPRVEECDRGHSMSRQGERVNARGFGVRCRACLSEADLANDYAGPYTPEETK